MADQVIKLPDGQSVNLKDDGTWEYVEEKILGALILNFGKTIDQQGQCYAWPSLTNDTNRFIDAIAIVFSTHLDDGSTIRSGTLTYNVVGVGKKITNQEYLTRYATAQCDDVEYIQIDGVTNCRIGGLKKDAGFCLDLLEVSADEITIIK